LKCRLRRARDLRGLKLQIEKGPEIPFAIPSYFQKDEKDSLMAKEIKVSLLEDLSKRFGSIRKLEGSQSLYDLGDGAARIYVRYSKVHRRNQAFYGLRQEDLKNLEGLPSFICFIWDGQTEPLFVPFADFQDIFYSNPPASDGQYKPQIYLGEATELYIPSAGRFNVDAYLGWNQFENQIASSRLTNIPTLSHHQVQTLLGAIGFSKGFDVWVPQSDRARLEWSLTGRFECCDSLPFGYEKIIDILQEVDTIWIERGSSKLTALFEVEHSTPIYSGLLRFNDVHLIAPTLKPRFSIVSNETRRILFVRQINRPTFRASGLSDLCTFFEYADVFGWHNRIKGK